MKFSEVIESFLAGEGKKFENEHWNGKDMFITAQYPDEHSKMSAPYIYMVTKNGIFPWSPSNLDVFSYEWKEV